MSNSSLVEYTKLSPNNSGKRTHSIDRITPHCVVGQISIETLGSIFANSKAQASSNYGIGVDGKVGLFVDEASRSWCSSSSENDQRAVTIECASDTKDPYAFNDTVYKKLIDLCIDICKRNGKTKLIWINSKTKALKYEPKDKEMLITVHRWFADKACPGDWLMSKMNDLVEKVNAGLSKKTTHPYKVRKSWEDAKSQIGAYKDLETAKKNCKEGYSVYNSKGKVLYTKKAEDLAKKTVKAKNGLWLHTRATTSFSTRKTCLPYGTTFYIYETKKNFTHGYAIIRGVKTWGWVASSYLA